MEEGSLCLGRCSLAVHIPERILIISIPFFMLLPSFHVCTHASTYLIASHGLWTVVNMYMEMDRYATICTSWKKCFQVGGHIISSKFRRRWLTKDKIWTDEAWWKLGTMKERADIFMYSIYKQLFSLKFLKYI